MQLTGLISKRPTCSKPCLCLTRVGTACRRSSRGRAAGHHTLGSSTASIMVTPVDPPATDPDQHQHIRHYELHLLCSSCFSSNILRACVHLFLASERRLRVESRHSERRSPYEAIFELQLHVAPFARMVEASHAPWSGHARWGAPCYTTHRCNSGGHKCVEGGNQR
jgi:hypothetical protein